MVKVVVAVDDYYHHKRIEYACSEWGDYIPTGRVISVGSLEVTPFEHSLTVRKLLGLIKSQDLCSKFTQLDMEYKDIVVDFPDMKVNSLNSRYSNGTLDEKGYGFDSIRLKVIKMRNIPVYFTELGLMISYVYLREMFGIRLYDLLNAVALWEPENYIDYRTMECVGQGEILTMLLGFKALSYYITIPNQGYALDYTVEMLQRLSKINNIDSRIPLHYYDIQYKVVSKRTRSYLIASMFMLTDGLYLGSKGLVLSEIFDSDSDFNLSKLKPQYEVRQEDDICIHTVDNFFNEKIGCLVDPSDCEVYSDLLNDYEPEVETVLQDLKKVKPVKEDEEGYGDTPMTMEYVTLQHVAKKKNLYSLLYVVDKYKDIIDANRESDVYFIGCGFSQWYQHVAILFYDRRVWFYDTDLNLKHVLGLPNVNCVRKKIDTGDEIPEKSIVFMDMSEDEPGRELLNLQSKIASKALVYYYKLRYSDMGEKENLYMSDVILLPFTYYSSYETRCMGSLYDSCYVEIFKKDYKERMINFNKNVKYLGDECWSCIMFKRLIDKFEILPIEWVIMSGEKKYPGHRVEFKGLMCEDRCYEKRNVFLYPCMRCCHTELYLLGESYYSLAYLKRLKDSTNVLDQELFKRLMLRDINYSYFSI
jgi:hypothetical protein